MKRHFSPRFKLWIIIPLLAIVALLSGCDNQQLEQWKADVAAKQQMLDTAKQEFDALVGENNLLEQALAEAQALAPQDDPVAKLEWEKQVADLREKLAPLQIRIDQARGKVDEYAQKLKDLGDQIIAAETGEEAIGSTVSSVGAMISAATGQPLIGVIGGLIGFGVRMIGDRKRRKLANDAGAAATAAGIESARDDKLEESLGGNYLVVEKAAAAINHVNSGVAGAIEVVSRRTNSAIGVAN